MNVMKKLLEYIVNSEVDNKTKFQLLSVCYPKCEGDNICLILRWRISDLYEKNLVEYDYLFKNLKNVIEPDLELPDEFYIGSYKCLLSDDFRELTAPGKQVCDIILKK